MERSVLINHPCLVQTTKAVIPYSVSDIHILGRVRVDHHLFIPRRDEGPDAGGDRRRGPRFFFVGSLVLTHLFSPRSSNTRTPENSQPRRRPSGKSAAIPGAIISDSFSHFPLIILINIIQLMSVSN
jgi:hypothetical protein